MKTKEKKTIKMKKKSIEINKEKKTSRKIKKTNVKQGVLIYSPLICAWKFF